MSNAQYDWKRFWFAACLVAACACPQPVWAAEQKGAGEFAIYGGGVSLSDGGGAHPTAGVDIGARISKNLGLFGEVGYVPLGSSSFAGNFSGVQVSSRASAKMYLFGGGLRYFFGSSSKATPFVEVTAGNAHVSGSASGSAAGVNVSTSLSDNSLYYGGGVGLRYALGDRWALRPELRYVHFNGGGGAFTYGAALLFQFGK